MKKYLKEITELLTMFVMAVLFFLITVLVKGFVFLTIWQWIIDPLFEIKNITFFQAVAVVFVAAYFSSNIITKDYHVTIKNIFIDVLKNLKLLLHYSLLILFLSWIIHLLIT